MKKIMSLLLFMICLFNLTESEIISASELCTPSGIEYSNIESELDAYVKKYEAGLASCEVAVFDRSGLITSRYYGYSDIENSIPADEETVYEWGSCSKILVWISVMQQAERGNIDLDRDVREYLPEGFLTKLQYEDEKITMIDLMNHKAGFQESFFENQSCKEDALYDDLEQALRACECYQAYHVGEYTAYSNYGTALAAYVVECASGEDYREYVINNIFKQLGMEHTSIDPHVNDNDYVKEKRKELKCYARYSDEKDNEDYGVCRSWVQLYPAGCVTGTLDDFAKLGMALVAKDSVLFENNSTMQEMISPTAFFGDTDIAKNCHGLWTKECKVQILGHGGNTDGCSSMLEFDPVSGLGTVIMTNESVETMFNYGIPDLLFGEIIDRPEYKNGYVSDDEDISGFYFSQTTIDSGAANFYRYIGRIFPISKNKEGSYDVAFNVDPDNKLYKIAQNQYVLERNGMKDFMYYSTDNNGKNKFEMMSQDIISCKSDTAKMVLLFSSLALGVICIAILAVKILIFIIFKARKKQINYNKRVIAVQVIYVLNCASVMGLLNVTIGNVYWFTVVSSLLAVCAGLFAAFNGIMLIFSTVKEKIKNKTKINQYIWGAISVMYCVFIITFQVYKFWTL